MKRAVLRLAVLVGVVSAFTAVASAALASDVPCTSIGAGRYQCSFYPPGDGISGGAPVQDASGARVGYLNQGHNWVDCQASGAAVHSGPYYNRFWAYTEANDQHFGWVNAVWARGGSNNGPFQGVPGCGGRHGHPPGGAPPKPKPRPRNMVALGDSYSSGEGTEPNSGHPCLQSRQAYGWLVASALHYSMTDFAACAGAKTRDVFHRQLGGLKASTTLVTMSVGGDDADFAGVLARCAGGLGVWTTPCKNMIAKESGIIRNDLPGRLDRLYSAIRRDAPHAKVVIVGYPYIFYGACDKSKPLQWLVKPDNLLDATVAAAAKRHAFTFVDPRGPFKGHSACDKDPWINHLYTHDLTKSFHPNAAGYRHMAALVERAVR